MSTLLSSFTKTTKAGLVGLSGFFLFVGGMTSLYAAITTNNSADLTNPNQTIVAGSVATAVVGLNLVSSSETLSSVTISVNPSAGFVASTDFATLGTATSSGIALYRDNKSGGVTGSFDVTDTVLTLSGAPTWTGATTTLTLASAETVPTDDTGANAGNDYFVVIKTNASAVNAHAVSFNLYPGQVGYSSGTPTTTPTTLTTQTVTVDTSAPTIQNIGPANNQTGVPISTFIGVGFNESMDFSTLSSTNVRLTAGGIPIGTSLMTFPMGLNMIPSDPPTFAASTTVFSKVASTAFGFFMIANGSPVMPQGGTYSAPSAGDIVYFQHDTFPAELGIITNSTLTGGTFAVNNFPLYGGQSIIKFRTPTATGAVSAATVLGEGDLIVVNTTANPTGDRYAWHVVTTGAAVNNASLRLDGVGAAPTYVTGSSFSTVRPTATTTVNGSNQITATTTFSVGDLVFAKVTANADNLGAYAWHVVTTAETINAGASGAVPSTLRLDNGAAAPTFAANSMVAKLAAGTQGLVTDTETSLGYGDIVFTKTTANAGVNGSYAFHLVSSGNSGTGGVASTNLRFDNSSKNLANNTTYTLTVGTGVKDRAGNPLAATSTTSFTTGSTGATNNTPPFVQSSQPQPGNQTFSPNAPLKVTFSVDMAVSGAGSATSSANVGLYTSNFGALGTQVSTTNTYDAVSKTVSLVHAALSTATEYILVVKTTTQSTTGAPIAQEYRSQFKTASATDSSAPTVLGSYPQNSATGVSRSVIAGVGFSEDMDPSTITSSTVTLKKTSDSSAVTGTVAYNPQSRGVTLAPSAQLLGNTQYTLTVASSSNGVKDLAGNALAADYSVSFTTDNVTDSTAPGVSFSNADNFGVAVTFSEPMKQSGGPNAADNISNYTLESPVGSSIALGGKTITYDAGTKTARISGLSLQNGNSFKVTVGTQVQDLAANGIDTTGSPAKNTAFGTVANSTMTGGQLGPGSGPANDPGMQGMNPIRVTPVVRAAGATSNYHVEFLAATTIPATGQIVLTFPAGFDVTNAAAVTAGTVSFCNSDLNGPMLGTVTIGSIANDNAAGTVTITTAGTASGANAFICLDLSGIVNSTIPSTTGYTVDIKTKDTAGNNRSVLETKTSAPFFLGQSGSNTLTIHVFHDDNSNSTKDAGEEIANVGVYLFSPATGSQSATTNASGVATFTSLTDGDYQVGLQPSTLSGYAFNPAPQQLMLSGSVTKKFILSAAPRTITGTIYGPASTKVDVFAGSPNGFAKTTVTTNSSATTTGGVSYGGSVSYSLGVQNNTMYQVGVGPNIPEASLAPGATTMAPPTFTFMPPQPSTVNIVTTNISNQNFTLTTASNSIIGSVKDSANAAVSGAGVFCRPVQSDSNGTASGFGTGGQTGTDGLFTLRTTPGVYLCGVFKPGMPSVPDKQVSIATDGTQTPATLAFTLGASASSLTITGTIKDDSGNPVPYSGVSGRKVSSTSDTTALGGSAGNFVGGPSDANGAYTLYVTTGTWVVEAFAPGVGRLGSKTISVGSASVTGQDFSAQTLNLGTISGTVTRASAAAQGVMVRAETADGTQGNMTPTAADGTYSLKVPAGTYTVKCFFPGIGESAPLTNITVTSNTTTSNHDCSVASPITVSVQVTDGTNPITNAFVDVRDSNGRGNGTGASVSSGANAIYTVTVPPGTYTVRVGHPSYGQIGSAQTATTTQTLTFTSAAGALFSVSGTITGNDTPLSGAWVSITGTPTGQTNMINAGAQTSTTGTYTVNVPAGSYSLRINKPGYTSPSPTSVSVTAPKTVGTANLVTAARTISGTVRLSGNGVAGAFVDANDGSGGFAVAQTDSNGAYSLAVDNGTWVVRARGQGYEASPVNVTIASSNASQDLTLTAISGFTIKPERQENVTPTAGGLLTNTDIGSTFKVNIPANALGTSANAGTVKTQTNTAVPTPATGSILSKNAVTISASDSSGQPIKNLNDDVTIVVPYNESDIPSGQTESNLVLGVWNDGTQTYDVLPTTIDTTNNTLTAVVSHFSDFAPLIPNNSSNGTTASQSSSSITSGGGSFVSSGVSTTQSPTITTPQTSTPAAVQTKTETQAQTTSVSPLGISPYTRSITIGVKGEDVASLQAFLESKGFLVMPKGVAKGEFGGLTRAALTKYQRSVGLPAIGIFGPATKAKVESESGVANPPTGTTVTVSVPASEFTYAKNLSFGSSGTDVASLQAFLESKGFLVMPKGQVKGYYGAATRAAVLKYQKAVGIPGANGNFGPATRAKVNTEMKTVNN